MGIVIHFNPANKGPVLPVVDCGAPVPEKFIGNMGLKLSGCFELHGGVWVPPQGREDGEDLSGFIGIVRTHERAFLVRKSNGNQTMLP